MQINSIYITMCLLIVTTMLFVATNADKFWPHHSRHHHRHHSHEKFHSRDYTSNSDENNSESHHFLSQPNAKGHHHRHDHHCGHHHYRSKETGTTWQSNSSEEPMAEMKSTTNSTVSPAIDTNPQTNQENTAQIDNNSRELDVAIDLRMGE